jgi:hypothetical protein
MEDYEQKLERQHRRNMILATIVGVIGFGIVAALFVLRQLLVLFSGG